MISRTSLSIPCLAAAAVAAGAGYPPPKPTLPDHGITSRGVFELVNHQSGFIPIGSSRIVAVSVRVTHRANLLPGHSEGLEVQFFTRPIAADTVGISTDEMTQLTKHDHAVLVIYLDRGRKVSQVNLSYVVPGTTVARTIAWTPEDLAKWSSACQFDDKRLRLAAKGVLSEQNARRETLALSWDIDIDLPVTERNE